MFVPQCIRLEKVNPHRSEHASAVYCDMKSWEGSSIAVDSFFVNA
jgi:hypothetical protein